MRPRSKFRRQGPAAELVKGRGGATVLRPKYGHGFYLSRLSSLFCNVEGVRDVWCNHVRYCCIGLRWPGASSDKTALLAAAILPNSSLVSRKVERALIRVAAAAEIHARIAPAFRGFRYSACLRLAKKSLADARNLTIAILPNRLPGTRIPRSDINHHRPERQPLVDAATPAESIVRHDPTSQPYRIARQKKSPCRYQRWSAARQSARSARNPIPTFQKHTAGKPSLQAQKALPIPTNKHLALQQTWPTVLHVSHRPLLRLATTRIFDEQRAGTT
jgi:hypothetical protein